MELAMPPPCSPTGFGRFVRNAQLSEEAPFQAKVKMKVFTLSGEQILDKDFGEWPAQSYVLGSNGYIWNKTNQSGRKVARGLYYAVIRVEESLGGKNVFQSIKKVLVP